MIVVGPPPGQAAQARPAAPDVRRLLDDGDSTLSNGSGRAPRSAASGNHVATFWPVLATRPLPAIAVSVLLCRSLEAAVRIRDAFRVLARFRRRCFGGVCRRLWAIRRLGCPQVIRSHSRCCKLPMTHFALAVLKAAAAARRCRRWPRARFRRGNGCGHKRLRFRNSRGVRWLPSLRESSRHGGNGPMGLRPSSVWCLPSNRSPGYPVRFLSEASTSWNSSHSGGSQTGPNSNSLGADADRTRSPRPGDCVAESTSAMLNRS